jgi:hypothetical protein
VVLVRFSIGRWYGTGTDEQVVDELREAKQATGDIGTFTKRLMKRERLLEINRITNDSRRFHKVLTLPWGDNKDRLLCVDAYKEYKKRMSAYEREFFGAVDSFIEKYDAAVLDERKRLGDLWRKDDYPTAEEMRARFRFGLTVDVLADTTDLRLQMSAEQAKEIKEGIEKRVHAEIKQAVGDIYTRLADEVTEIKGQLDDPDARLQGKMFNTIQEIVGLLPKLNIMRDPALTALGRDILKELTAVPASELKQPEERKKASAKAAGVLDMINRMKKGTK